MVPRYLKISLAAVVSLLCLISAAQNFSNLGRGYQAVAYTTSMQDHLAYPSAIGPRISAPAINWVIFGLIILSELAAGLMAGKGAWDLWAVRRSAAPLFNSTKANAQIGVGAAVLVWFGLFAAVGSAYFGMWQTAAGAGALTVSFPYATMCGIVLLFISMPDYDY